MLYEKRFGLLQKNTGDEALNFIMAVKTVSIHRGVLGSQQIIQSLPKRGMHTDLITIVHFSVCGVFPCMDVHLGTYNEDVY